MQKIVVIPCAHPEDVFSGEAEIDDLRGVMVIDAETRKPISEFNRLMLVCKIVKTQLSNLCNKNTAMLTFPQVKHTIKDQNTFEISFPTMVVKSLMSYPLSKVDFDPSTNILHVFDLDNVETELEIKHSVISLLGRTEIDSNVRAYEAVEIVGWEKPYLP